MITANHYLIISGILFCIGLFGAITNRNIIRILLSIEIMLNSANLAFIVFSARLGNLTGQIFVLFTIVAGATNLAVSLAIAIMIFKARNELNADTLNKFKW